MSEPGMSEPWMAPPPPAGPVSTPPVRRLRRSKQDRVLGGVCGGMGAYFGIDPVVLRIVMVALVFAGVGVVAYLIAWLVIPEADDDHPDAPAQPESQHSAAVLGAVLIGLGALLTLRALVPWFESPVFWPLVVICGGLVLVLSARRRGD